MLDIIVFLLLGVSFIKGYRDGLLKSVFNFLAWILGLALAMKFTEYITFYIIDNYQVKTKLLPALVFVGLFILVNFIVMRISSALEMLFEKLKISFLNNIGGGLLSAGLLLILMSVLLFYVNEMGFISEKRKQESWTYSNVAPLGPMVIGFVTSNFDNGKDAFQKIKEKYQNIQVPNRDSLKTM